MITYLSYIHNWLRLIPNKGTDEANTISIPTLSPVSIGIALHNEESSVKALIHNLSILSSKKILVLDHCTDNTSSVIDSSIAMLSREQQSLFSVFSNPYDQGKKQALRFLVEKADTQYVLTTDADCLFSPEWEKGVISYINRHNPDLLLLPVGIQKRTDSLRENLFCLDFLSLQMATVGSALSGKPTMANGANICFTRKLYLEHNSNSQYASGDDMFLLSEAKRLNKRIDYCYTPQAAVRTPMPDSWSAFFNQHARWFRKSSGYTDRDVIRLGWATFSATFFAPLLFICLPVNFQWITALCVIIKTTYEFQLLKRAERFFSIPVHLLHVILFALLYPILTIVIITIAATKSKRSW